MLVACIGNPKIHLHGKEWESKTLPGLPVKQQLNQIPKNAALSTRLKEMLKSDRVEQPVSSYDTAWVAMVPSVDSSKNPQFPECLNWLLENQHPDGSWALDPTHPLLLKDSLTSTLASVLALYKWNSAQQLVDKGLDFIVSNIWAATDKHQLSPIGFDIIFPGMIDYARDMGLNLPFDPSSIDRMILKRDSEIKSFQDQGGNLAYVAEGLTGSHVHHWNDIMKYQRSNGSLFNSPSTTAAAFVHLGDANCFRYLNSLVKEFNNAVPTIYPMDIYTRLTMIDNLRKLGIDRHFQKEIEKILDDVYRCWTHGSDEVFLDAKCCAMSFRLLRFNGYEISSGVLADFDRKENFLHSSNGHENDIKSVLEFYKASQATIFQNEPVLDRLHDWTTTYLQHKLSSGSIQEWSLRTEVDYALKHPHASLERIESRNYIENYNIDNIPLLKTSYRFWDVNHRDLLAFSSKDFNFCQSIHQKELEHLEGWVRKYKINDLKFARQKIRYAYFAIASDIFQPHLTDVRAAWAQNSVLTTVVDDFFDFAGSMDELLNLIQLVERWDDHAAIGFKSKDVEILFYAIYGTINETAAEAKLQQGRCIKRHLIDIWITLLKTMLVEAEWAENQTVPTMYEYLSNGYVSFALGPVVLIPLYLMGHQLSEEVIQSKEYNNIFMHMSMIGRLTNDQVSVQREGIQGKLNSVSLQVVHGRGAVTEEEAQEEVSRMIESHRRELLRMVVQKKGSMIPRSCKDLFWTMSKVLHLFYKSDDGYSSPVKMVSAVNAIINEPIIFPTY